MRLDLSGALALCCCILQFTGVLADLYLKSKNITAVTGSDVTLRCKPSSDIAIVSQVNWSVCNGSYIAYQVTSRGHIEKAFRQKVALADGYGITLLNVSSHDTGLYCCSYNIFPDGTVTGEIFLNITAVTESEPMSHWYYVFGVLGVMILLVSGSAGISCYKRKAGSGTNQNEYMNGPVMPAALSVGTAGGDVSEEDNGMEYFNILLYRL
ncbi:T-cell immunoreceptor with Ig and ITIM domains [Pelodytes ibericus]